jgi:hypothetical protein
MVKNEKSGFFSGWVVFRTPPEVVSGFFFFFFWGGGGGVRWHVGVTPVQGGGFGNNHSGPPPLVKLRMVRGGPENLIPLI